VTNRLIDTEAQAHLMSLLDGVEAGQEVEITRHGRTVARLVAASASGSLKGSLIGVAMTASEDEQLFTTGVAWSRSAVDHS
jgi:prevent-host-death family protein